jgi:hypothetical protein
MKICAPQPAAGYASRLSNGVKSTIEMGSSLLLSQMGSSLLLTHVR